jgi:hypothetical protein
MPPVFGGGAASAPVARAEPVRRRTQPVIAGSVTNPENHRPHSQVLPATRGTTIVARGTAAAVTAAGMAPSRSNVKDHTVLGDLDLLHHNLSDTQKLSRYGRHAHGPLPLVCRSSTTHRRARVPCASLHYIPPSSARPTSSRPRANSATHSNCRRSFFNDPGYDDQVMVIDAVREYRCR